MLRSYSFGLSLAGTAVLLCATTDATARGGRPEPVKAKRKGVEPSAEEQLFIYLLNKARHDPSGYGRSIKLDLDKVAPTPPLAPNRELTAAARFRGIDMAQRGYFSHVDPDGVGPNHHALESGYALSRRYSRKKDANNIESISAGRPRPAAVLSQLIIDKGTPGVGHRKHLLAMDTYYRVAREIGAGFVVPKQGGKGKPKGKRRTYRAYASILTARTDRPEAFITGVVYEDRDGNGAYDEGEGLEGVTVSGGGRQVASMRHGGFSLPVKSGSVIVGCHKGAFKGQTTAKLNMRSDNIHIEFVSGRKDGVVNFGKPLPPPSGGGRKRR